MQATWKACLAASEEHANVEDELSNMLDHPDGAHAVHEAAKKERVALENYARALRAFTDLTLHDAEFRLATPNGSSVLLGSMDAASFRLGSRVFPKLRGCRKTV